MRTKGIRILTNRVPCLPNPNAPAMFRGVARMVTYESSDSENAPDVCPIRTQRRRIAAFRAPAFLSNQPPAPTGLADGLRQRLESEIALPQRDLLLPL